MHTCPVLDLHAREPELAVFDACYRFEVLGMGGAARYARIALPVAGGVLEQPARVMAALDLIEVVANAELESDLRERRSRPQEPEGDRG